MNNKDINELIAISYFDDDDLSIKEHCDIYFTIQKEIIHILNKYNIKWTITDTKSYNDKDKEIDRLNNIIDDAYNYLEDKNYVRGKDLVKVNDTDVNELYKILEKKVNNDCKKDV